jgi:hypothetical protein
VTVVQHRVLPTAERGIQTQFRAWASLKEIAAIATRPDYCAAKEALSELELKTLNEVVRRDSKFYPGGGISYESEAADHPAKLLLV